jgi:hypothetical protein
VHTDNTVIFLSGIAAPLSLDTGGVDSFFRMAGIINSSDCIRMAMVSGNDPLNPVTEPLLIPMNVRQESLQCSRRCPGQQSDRFDAFAIQRRYLTPHVTFEVLSGLRAVKTVIKLFQKCVQFFANVFDFFCVHTDKPPNNAIQRTYWLNIFKSLSPYGAVVVNNPKINGKVRSLSSKSRHYKESGGRLSKHEAKE